MRISALVLPLFALGCQAFTAPDALGNWGGPEASMVLTASGGTVSYACGAGTIDSDWTLSPSGDFAATGQHFFGGGPVPVQGHQPHPAVYAGRVRGSELTLTVTLTDLKETLGPFTLVRDGPVVVELCV
jgi:hypothetical protein